MGLGSNFLNMTSKAQKQIQINGTDRKPRDKMPIGAWVLSLTKEARIYNGEKTASSISGAGKTRQLHVKD